MTMTARPRRTRALLAATGSLAVALVAILAAQASAATYHSYLCRVPYGPNAGKPAPTDNTAYTHAGTFVSAFQNCSTGGA